MAKKFSFADHTVKRAISLDLPTKDTEQIIKTLQKYPVSCFDIECDTLLNFPTQSQLIPDSMLRLGVYPGDETLTGFAEFKKIRINWKHGRGNNLDPLYKAAKSATKSELYLAIQNAQTLDLNEFETYFEWARQAHAEGIIYCSDGAEDVTGLYERLSKLVKNAPCAVEFEGQNTLGLATAQALSALKAGVERVSASAAGAGGLTPFEEVLMAAKYLWLYEFSQGKELAGDFQLISTLAGVKIPRNKALIGPDVFAHESGIHVDGIIKDPSIYEVIRPEDVGLKRKLVIGKHSGTASLKIRALQWGFQLTNGEAACLLELVRELAQEQKGPLSDHQLIDLFASQYVKGRRL